MDGWFIGLLDMSFDIHSHFPAYM